MDEEPALPQSRRSFVPAKNGPTDFRTVLRYRLPLCGTGIALFGALLFFGLWNASREDPGSCPTVGVAGGGLTECQRDLLDGRLEGYSSAPLFAGAVACLLLAAVFIGLSLRRKRVAAGV